MFLFSSAERSVLSASIRVLAQTHSELFFQQGCQFCESGILIWAAGTAEIPLHEWHLKVRELGLIVPEAALILLFVTAASAGVLLSLHRVQKDEYGVSVSAVAVLAIRVGVRFTAVKEVTARMTADDGTYQLSPLRIRNYPPHTLPSYEY
ncbi:MAG TPA: hypothetical protein VFB28_03900 [Terriglobales bacterium]|nr:hypothetical protein [Terriglobales bacterium]